MPSRSIFRLVVVAVLASASTAFAQSGLRVPERGEPGLDPGFARGWLAPDFDRFGFASYSWKESLGFAATRRMNWSYAFGERADLGMTLGSARDFEYDQRQLSIYGRYWFAPDWAVSAESASRDATGLFRLQDLRIGVQRRF